MRSARDSCGLAFAIRVPFGDSLRNMVKLFNVDLPRWRFVRWRPMHPQTHRLRIVALVHFLAVYPSYSFLHFDFPFVALQLGSAICGEWSLDPVHASQLSAAPRVAIEQIEPCLPCPMTAAPRLSSR